MKNRNRKRRFVAKIEAMEGRCLLSTVPQFTIKYVNSTSSPDIGGLNNLGQIAGVLDGHGFLSDPNGGAVHDLGFINGPIYSVNDSGQIAGYIRVYPSDGRSQCNPFFSDPNGGAIHIAATSPDMSGALAYDSINNSGQMAATILGWQGYQHAIFIPSDGTSIKDLGQGVAYGINDVGQVTGSINSHAFLSDPNGSGTHDLGQFPGGTFSAGYSVNSYGQVAGNAMTFDGYRHAFLSDPNGGPLHDLGALGGNNFNSYGISVNNNGDVVGYSFTPSGPHAFLYTNGTMYDLNTLVQNFHSGLLTRAFGINNSGQIAVTNGNQDFLLTLVTPPAPVAPTITWSNPTNITYGTPLSATQLNATASVPGTFTYSVPEGTVLHAGAAQSLVATFTPDDLVHYTTATAEASINVTKRPIIVYANPVTKVYGAPVPDGTFYYTGWNNQQGFVNGDTPQSIGLNPVLYSAGTVNASTPVGVYNAFPLVSNMFDDYTVSTGGTTITVTPAPLTVTASNALVHYGFTIPPLTGTITGLVNGDTDVATYTTTATRGSWAGYYPIVPHLTDPNYNITFVNGTLTIYWSVPPAG